MANHGLIMQLEIQFNNKNNMRIGTERESRILDLLIQSFVFRHIYDQRFAFSYFICRFQI